MYGLLLENLSEYIKTVYGDEKWEEVRKLAGKEKTFFSFSLFRISRRKNFSTFNDEFCCYFCVAMLKASHRRHLVFMTITMKTFSMDWLKQLEM